MKETRLNSGYDEKLRLSFVAITVWALLVGMAFGVGLDVASASLPEVLRSIDPPTVNAGGTVTNTFQFITTEDTSFISIRDQVPLVPSTWGVTDISATGDPFSTNFTSNGTVIIVWLGEMDSGEALTASYTLHVPSDAVPGEYPLTGRLCCWIEGEEEPRCISDFNGTVTVTPSALIALTPESYNFGTIEEGQCSSEYSFTLTNTGGGTATGSVSLTGVQSSQFTITSGGGGFSLGAGQEKTIKVKFCPTSAGSKTATLNAVGTNCNDDSSSLSGTGEAVPAIELTPPSYNFGTIEEGQCSSEYSFTLTNIGGGTATGSVSLTGAQANKFMITSGGGGFSLGAGQEKTIKVKFCPTSAGSKTATLYASGTNCNDDSSSLSGTGEAIPAIELTPPGYSFGTVEVDQCSSEYSFTLTNTGGGTATGSVSLTGAHANQFTITSGGGGFSLGAGQEKTIKVKFCPTSAGSKTATLNASGTNCNDASSSLSGGVEAAPAIELAPMSYNFGTIEVGQCSSEYSFTLYNTGGGTATGSVSLTAAHANQFTITSGGGSFSLGAGQEKTIKVTFCPTSAGSKSATLNAVGTNCNDDSSTLSGIGADEEPPLISNVMSSAITQTTATITWDTDEAADSRVKYGTTSGGPYDEAYDGADVTSHSMALTGLSANTTYYYVVNSTDPSGNIAESDEYSFKTLEAGALPRWDINQDGVVDDLDLGLLLLHYGETTSPPYPRWDVNEDGVVDDLDLGFLLLHYGEGE